MENPYSEFPELLEQFREFEEHIKTYLDEVINRSFFPEETEEILHLSKSELRALSEVACDEYAFLLRSYTHAAQRGYNLLQARETHLTDTINKILAIEWDNHDRYMPKEVKEQAIIQGNSFLQKVDAVRQVLRARLKTTARELEDVRKMSDILSDLARDKRFS